MRKPLHFALMIVASAALVVVTTGAFEPQGDQVVRGYFKLARQAQGVHVKSDADCEIHLWARNLGPGDGGVQVITPTSEFHGASEPEEGMVLDLPGQTGMDLGLIGAKAGETITFTQAYGSRVALYVTVVTSGFATVTMN